jgi:hypothetical protein
MGIDADQGVQRAVGHGVVQASRIAVSRRHVDRFGKPIERVSVLVDRHGGADGAAPSAPEFEALRSALGLAVIDAIPEWRSPVEIRAMARALATGRDVGVLRQSGMGRTEVGIERGKLGSAR